MIWLCILPLWLLCAIATAHLTAANGKNAAIGFAVGLAFGPIGVILALLDRTTGR